jgi:signal peptidase I
MHPTIRSGELITVAPVAPSEVKAGDVVLYRLDRHRRGVIAHRVVGIERTDRGVVRFVFRGDAADCCDAPVATDQVLGKVLAVDRAGCRIGVRSRRPTLRRLLWRCASRAKRALGGPRSAAQRFYRPFHF